MWRMRGLPGWRRWPWRAGAATAGCCLHTTPWPPLRAWPCTPPRGTCLWRTGARRRGCCAPSWTGATLWCWPRGRTWCAPGACAWTGAASSGWTAGPAAWCRPPWTGRTAAPCCEGRPCCPTQSLWPSTRTGCTWRMLTGSSC
uniref:Secreted protein n=1 Tax=Ixodes ricinus TaxID=34613 RepID=A0A147BRG9_IXORI